MSCASPGAVEAASEHPVAPRRRRRRGAPRSATLPRGRGLPQRAGHRRPRHASRATLVEVGRRDGDDHRRLGRRAARDARRSRHGQADERRGRRRAAAARARRPCCSPATAREPAERVAAEVGIERVQSPSVLARRQGRTRSGASRPRARWSRWSATASTTRPRSPRPTSASRSAPAPTSRSRRAT